MPDAPWRDKTLSRGQVRQRLLALSCKEIKIVADDNAVWSAPTGHIFSISYANCDADFLEGIVAQLEKWAKD